jgi:hypothetical protein
MEVFPSWLLTLLDVSMNRSYFSLMLTASIKFLPAIG